jgi:hypothetical protein
MRFLENYLPFLTIVFALLLWIDACFTLTGFKFTKTSSAITMKFLQVFDKKKGAGAGAAAAAAIRNFDSLALAPQQWVQTS